MQHLRAIGSPILARCCDGELHQATARTREQTLEILLPQSMVSSHVLPGILNGPGCDVDPAGRTVAVSANTLVNIYSLDAFQQLAALRKHLTAVVAARYINESQVIPASACTACLGGTGSMLCACIPAYQRSGLLLLCSF